MKEKMKKRNISVLFFGLVSCASIIHADAIIYPLSLVPAMGNPWWMVLQFLPIVLLEACILKKYLKIMYVEAVRFSFYANFVSTLAGIPIGLILNYGGFGNFFGLYPSAYGPTYHILETLTLFLLCFFLSWGIEYWVIRQMISGVSHRILNRAVLYANLLSYAGITLWWIFILFSDDRLGFIYFGGYKLLL